MERRKSWLSSIIKNSIFVLTKDALANAASNLRHKAKEKREGLVCLYKDMEACGGYADIQVMWEMIHSSSSPPNVQKNRKFKYWRFCFQN
ncbi:hypothetical protein ACS0TY_016189 [Phlomoides rotata]